MRFIARHARLGAHPVKNLIWIASFAFAVGFSVVPAAQALDDNEKEFLKGEATGVVGMLPGGGLLQPIVGIMFINDEPRAERELRELREHFDLALVMQEKSFLNHHIEGYKRILQTVGDFPTNEGKVGELQRLQTLIDGTAPDFEGGNKAVEKLLLFSGMASLHLYVLESIIALTDDPNIITEATRKLAQVRHRYTEHSKNEIARALDERLNVFYDKKSCGSRPTIVDYHYTNWTMVCEMNNFRCVDSLWDKDVFSKRLIKEYGLRPNVRAHPIDFVPLNCSQIKQTLARNLVVYYSMTVLEPILGAGDPVWMEGVINGRLR